MNDEYKFNDELERQLLKYLKDNDFTLSESDFYPPSDNRVLKSYIEDIDGGDNFTDYCEYIFELLEEEEYYD